MDQALRQLFNRPANTNKYDYGHVLVVGGSSGMVGAPLLAAQAALRVGAGLVSIASAPEVVDKLERRVEEVMTFAADNPEQMRAFIKQRYVNTLIIGPGLDEHEFELARELVKTVDLPVVLDAGGLAAYIGRAEDLKQSASKLILTPHAGEFQKLLGQKLPSSRKDIKDRLADFCKAHSVIAVLKGDHSLVGNDQGDIYENDSGNPGLATAGTGDVLAGVIGGLLAQGVETFAAAKLGVHLHGLAGDIAAKQKTEPGLIASDVIESIPKALKQLS